MGEEDTERGRADAIAASPVMEPMRLRNHAEDGRVPNERRDPEAPVRHSVMRQDVRPDVEDATDAEAGEHGTTEPNEQRRCQKRPRPQEVVPDDAVGGGMLVMRLVLAPERAVEHEAMHERHHGLGHDRGRECDRHFSEHL